MAELIGILGMSGSGKSTGIGENKELGIKGLDPNSTYIINSMGKSLPFQGWKNKYKTKEEAQKDNKLPNLLNSRDVDIIRACIANIDKNRPEIKTIVIDDFQYIMSGEFMDKAKQKGFDKYTEIACNAWDIVTDVKSLRPDINVFIISHTETETNKATGKSITKFKTVGQMVDQYVVLEGLFTVILFAEGEIKNNKVVKWFRTQSNGSDPCKSPHGMFKELQIINDLAFVDEAVRTYNKG